MNTGDDVHFACHSGHQIVGRILHLEHDGVTLSGRIGRWLDRRDMRGESAGPVGVQLQLWLASRA